MKGTFAVPNTASAAPSLSEPGPAYFRTNRYEIEISQPTNVIVSRGSQSHQMPHAFFAHNGPVPITSSPKSTVSSADAIASRSYCGCFFHRYSALDTPQTIAETSITMPDGAWKYMIFETSPIDCS